MICPCCLCDDREKRKAALLESKRLRNISVPLEWQVPLWEPVFVFDSGIHWVACKTLCLGIDFRTTK